MSEPAAVIVVDGIRAWPSDDDPHRFLYVPGLPEPQRGPDGVPTSSLIVAGESAILQLGASWGLGSPQDERLRTALAAAYPGVDAAAVVLGPAPVDVSEAALEVADGAGGFTAIATSPGSGYPPFAAIFSAALTGEQRSLATAALNGTPGSVRVRYRASGTVRFAASARLRGRLVGASRRERRSADPRADLEAALEEGTIRLEVDPTDAPEELARRARELVLEKAVRAIASGDAGRARAATRLELEATAVADLRAELEPTADVAGWFSEGGAVERHVVIAPGSETKT